MNRKELIKPHDQSWTTREVLLVIIALALAILVAFYAVEAHAVEFKPKDTFVDFLVWTVANPGWLITSILVVVAASLLSIWFTTRK